MSIKIEPIPQKKTDGLRPLQPQTIEAMGIHVDYYRGGWGAKMLVDGVRVQVQEFGDGPPRAFKLNDDGTSYDKTHPFAKLYEKVEPVVDLL